jgi:hypothetical protein
MDYKNTAKQIIADRHPTAIAAYWAGSLARGDGSATSDIDLVVIHAQLKNAWRDSFIVEGRLCETFVHDPQSLEIFFAQDAERGVPSMMNMVAEGVSLVDGEAGHDFQAEARLRLEKGPRPLNTDEMSRSRYAANDLVDDLTGATAAMEIRAVGATLYAHAFNHLRRANGKWSATGKHIARTLLREEGALGQEYLSAFDKLFGDADPTAVIEVVREIYAPCGGLLAEWRSDAPPHRDPLS